MAKKLFGLSVFLWILLALVVLFFVYGVGRREGFYASATCSERNNENGCKGKNGCTWTPQKCSDSKYYNKNSCENNGGTWSVGYCS